MTKFAVIALLAIVGLLAIAACAGDDEYEPAATAAPAAPSRAQAPTMAPTAAPTMAPAPTAAPFTAAPTAAPTMAPRATPRATAAPAPTAAPTMAPRAPASAAPTPTRPRPTAAPTPQAMIESATTRRATPAPTAAPTPAPAAAPAAAAATTFRDYAREQFVSTAVDNVSTFSLDTDRTSYFLALNWARNGYEVDPDSVRSEEWINAFNYGYEQPRRDDSFAISTDVVTHPLDSRMHLARIAFQAPDVDYDATPVNVTLVLDASGSMADGNRVDIAREAAGEHQAQPQRP